MLKLHSSFSLKGLIIPVAIAMFAFFASPLTTAASEFGEKELLMGAENSHVEKLQELLHERSILDEEYITGSFSEQTKEAVKAFQSEHNILPDDGIAGSYTIGAIMVLEEGDEGKPVQTLQEELNELGYYNHKVDGIFGTNTHHAVVLFQQTAGIQVDGLAGPETIGTLMQADDELRYQASAETTSPKNDAEKETEEQVASVTETNNTSSSPEGNTLNVSATAYTANCTGCSGITATGVDLHANPNAQVIAVDPNVIPLGSKVHVEGHGTYTAADTGGAINGNKIDIFMPNHQDAVNFGRRNLEVTILN